MSSVRIQVKTYVEAGEVIVKYNNKVIKELTTDEALECGGNIKKAGKKAEKYPEKTFKSPITGAEGLRNTSSNRLNKKTKKSNNPQNIPKHKVQEDKNWKSNNKNHLLNGSM